MIDARFEAARLTDQSGERGWDFSPERTEFSRPSFALVIVAVVVVAVALVGVWL